MCALFFIKKGFPFISILEGGFAAAHAWLARDCEYLTLTKVLIDYDEQSSLFADLERSYQGQKEFSNASTRRKTTLALQKVIDNSMTRLTILENRIEVFAERPRAKEAIKDKTSEPPELSKNKGNDEEKKVLKIPPMKSFIKSKSESGKTEEEGVKKVGSVDKSSTMNTNESKDQEDNPNNAMKNGFNKAFNGLKNIRLPKNEKKVIDNRSESKEKRILPFAKKEENVEPKAFDLGKINFSKKNNIFGRKSQQSKASGDDDLEKEIEASLRKPVEVPRKASKDKEIKPQVEEKKQIRNPFKNRLKNINLKKFGSIAQQQPLRSAPLQSIIREEESLFFEEESLDGTEDASSSLTSS